MKAYVWHRVEEVTYDYHSEGGALVVTDADPRDVLQAHVDASRPDGEGRRIVDFDGAEPVVFETDRTEPLVVIFPNSGCC